MQKLFILIFKISIESSFLIFFIFFMKKIANKYFTPTIHYYVWLFLVLKLILPFTIESEFNIFNYIKYNQETENIDKAVIKNQDNSYKALKSENITNESTENKDTYKNYKIEKFNIKNLDLMKILSYIWFLGFVVVSVIFISSQIIFYYRLKKSKLCTDKNIVNLFENIKQKFNIKRNIPIIIYENISTPTLFSFISPKLILQTDITKNFNQKEIDYIFRHELYHFIRKDLFVFLIVSVLKTIYWFNPLVWYSFYKMECDCESSCDCAVLKNLDKKECLDYGLTIVKILSNKNKNKINIGSLGTLKSYKDIKRRIAMISKFKNRTNKKSTTVIFTLFTLVAVSMFFTKPLTEKVSAEQTKKPVIEKNSIEIIKNPIIFDEKNNYIVIKKIGTIKSDEDVKQNDLYLDKQYEFVVTGVSEDKIQKVNNELISSVTTTTKDGITTVKILSNEIIAFSKTEDKDNMYFTAKRPEDIYKNIVIIDPAHGGANSGATNLKLIEKDLTLQLANQIKYINENTKNSQLKIYLTRQTDKFSTVEDRTKFANNLGGIYINLHYNMSPDKNANGTETYYFKENLESKKLATVVQEYVVKNLDTKDNGIKEDDFFTIKNVKLAAISLEAAFLSNTDDIKKIAEKEFNEKVSLSILNALNKYYETSNTYKVN